MGEICEGETSTTASPSNLPSEMAPSCRSPALDSDQRVPGAARLRAHRRDSRRRRAEHHRRSSPYWIALHLAVQPFGDLLVFPGELNAVAAIGGLGAVDQFGETVLVALGFAEDIVGDVAPGRSVTGKRSGANRGSGSAASGGIRAA